MHENSYQINKRFEALNRKLKKNIKKDYEFELVTKCRGKNFIQRYFIKRNYRRDQKAFNKKFKRSINKFEFLMGVYELYKRLRDEY